jgi:DNA-binding CsgD family transcriptional regulator/tetratricopeptide (TPR) repeat protein
MALLAEQLVGRAEELGGLDNALDELTHGRSAAIELVGEPGIGKTRLLAELARRAAEHGQLVLSGRAAELERDLPFWVFVDALDEYVQGLDPRRLDFLDDNARAELAHVLPSLSAHAAGSGMPLQHERYRTHRAVRELLGLLAQTKPLVLVLDDLHWADSGSVELVGALLRRPPAAPVLMALAVRPRQVPERLSAALERAHREGTLARLELGALTRSEAGELLGEAVESAVATALYEESGGNPFYLEQLARSPESALQPSSAASELSLGDLDVPPMVAAALTEELALLSDGARRVLEGAAVAGDPFEPELAAAAAAVSESSAVDALDELLALDLVRHTDVPRRFRFRHPLVRRAVYEAAPSGWRLGAHERTAEALAARGTSTPARAHHVERCARQGDAAAVAVLRDAAEQVAPRAPATAARWFAGALRLLPQTAPANERGELLLARAGALTTTGQFADSHAALLEGLAIVPQEAIALRGKLTAACAEVEHLLGHQERAHTRLATTLESLPAVSPESVALMIDLSMNAFYRGEYQSMQDWAGRAVSATRVLDEPPLMAAAVAVLALGDAMIGATEQAQADRSEAAALVDSLSDDELALRLDAAAWLAGAELYMDRYAEAARHAERALAVGRATGQGELFLVLSQILGRAWYVRGRLAEVTELLDGAIDAARLLGNTHALAWNLFNRSVVALAVGDVDVALDTARESVDLSRDLDEGFISAWAATRLAAVLLETGQPAEAVELLVASAGGEELTLIPGGWRAYCLELLTRCWLALDRRSEAERAAACARARATAVPLPLVAAWADRAAAAVALHAGDPTRAAERALASAAAADEVGAPIEAALSRTLAGRALAQGGHGERATAELERAVAELNQCGALRYRNEAERELRKLGHSIHRRTRPGKTDGIGIASLTERELEIARLVVDRKTNSEIAAALFLSPKTIETHLRNIFRKLNVFSRAEVARAVERAEGKERALSQ